MLMRRSLSHLPRRKKDELRRIADTIIEMVPATQMVILFGSHARGDWVEDRYEKDGRIYEYMSDYDIMVVTDTRQAADSTSVWSKVEKKIRAPQISETWTTLITHDIDYVNRRITKAAYFFVDVKKEGICLYNTGKHRLARLCEPDPRERFGQAKANLEYWFQKSKEFFLQFKAAYNRKSLSIAAFELHQATENLYHSLLLVFTGYKPKLHDLEKLGHLTNGFGKELLTVFPTATEEERKRFQLLKRAYTEARYEPRYRITKEELDYLAERVRLLQDVVKLLCERRIAKYEEEAAAFKEEQRGGKA
jgi:uncharacterized protein